jgi:hypothetical protein
MKFVHARIVTQDVPGLARFYRELTAMTPVGDDRYTELHGPQLSLAISSQRMIELHSAGAATARFNRSISSTSRSPMSIGNILDCEVS